MKVNLKNSLAGLLAIPLLAMGLVAVSGVGAGAIDTNGKCEDGKVTVTEGVDCAKGDGTQEELFLNKDGNESLFKTVTNVLLFLIGAISVIMLIIGGFKYVLSNGDSAAVTSAKNTILYAVIGIIIALLAYAIVNFVVTSFIK